MLPSSLRASGLLSSSVVLMLAVAACGGSTVDPPGSGAVPNTAATTTASTSPPSTPSTPSSPAQPAEPSTPTGSQPGAPSGPPTNPPPTNPPPTANACNALVNSGPVIAAVQIAADAPAPTGGTISDGTYRLTDLTLYTGVGGNVGPIAIQLRQTVDIHGAFADAVTESSGKSEAMSTTIVTSGTSVTNTETCPKAGTPDTAQYSATPTSIVFYQPSGSSGTAVSTYSK